MKAERTDTTKLIDSINGQIECNAMREKFQVGKTINHVGINLLITRIGIVGSIERTTSDLGAITIQDKTRGCIQCEYENKGDIKIKQFFKEDMEYLSTLIP